MISVLPVYLTASFHADKGVVGLVMGSFMVASVLMRPFAGFALDRYGRRTIFTTALLVNSVFFVGYIVARYVGALAAIRIIHGLAWGVITISGSIIAADNIPENKRGEGFGYYGLSTTMAMAVGPVIGLFVCASLGYFWMFWVIVFISLAGFICASMINYPKLIRSEKVHFRWGNLFEKNSISASVNLMIIMSAYGGLLSFVALYGKEIGIESTSWFFLVFAIGIAISRFGLGQVFDKKGPKNILTGCLVMLIAGFIYLALLKNRFAYYSSGIILGYGVGAVFPTFQAIINNMVTVERRGAGNSTLYTALDLGMGAGMVFTGYLGEHFSISLAFILCALIILAGLVYFRTNTLQFYKQHKLV